MALKEIERKPLPARREFYRLDAATPHPVIYENGMDGWRARTLWTFDWFKAQHGDTQVFVKTSSYDSGMTYRHTALGEYVDSLFADHAPDGGYLSNINLFRLIPTLAEDVRFPPYQWLNRLTLRNFWMARTGQLTQLHCDYGHNLLGQVVGYKRFQLYSPAVTNKLFATNTGWAGSFSQIDYANAEPHIRAAARDIEPDYDVLMEPGELLFLPYGWWHRVITEQAAIGVNLWWWTPQMLLARGPRMVRELGSSYVRKRLRRRGRLASAANA